eukprot:Gb_36951 [translate_table: standard]
MVCTRCCSRYVVSPGKVDIPLGASLLANLLSARRGGTSGKKSMPAKC